MRPLLLLPEILLFVGGLAVLISGSFLPRRRLWVTRLAAALVLVAAIVAAAVLLAGPDGEAFDGTFRVDTATGVARMVAAFATLLVLGLASDEIAGSPRESEIYALALFATTGTVLLAGANDLLVLAPAFLLASIPIYGLIGLTRTPEGAEATLKAYLMGALFGIVLLLGITVVYGVSGSTHYVDFADRLAGAAPAAVAAGVFAIVCGLMFEAGGLPAHFWVPDAAQGSTGTVAAYLTTVPKIGALIAIYRLVLALPETLNVSVLIAVLAAASMTLGNLAAYWQQDPRRLLGWSTVAQVGFLLVPVAATGRSDLALPSLLFYLLGYTVTNVAAFAVTTALPALRDLKSYRGLGFAHPWLAAALAVALLGLVGTPPTAVFIGKVTTATAAWDGGYAWLALVVLANSLISLFYYLRWIMPTVSRGQTDTPENAPSRWAAGTAVTAAALSVALGIGAGAVWAIVGGS
ncbi:hypothetical protein NGTWS1803_20650 [Mycolicibacterium cyprinidarum]|nr:hypothetical protein NGTWS1803_20650 [Mycolicibacterium sp. NGTWS1803]